MLYGINKFVILKYTIDVHVKVQDIFMLLKMHNLFPKFQQSMG